MNSADRQMLNLGLLVTVIAVIGAAVAGGELDEESSEGEDDIEPVIPLFNQSTTGTLNEGDSSEDTWNPEGKTATKGTFILTWTDEDDITPAHENQGDRFTLRVEAPDGESIDEDSETNEHGEQGQVTIVIDFIEEKGYKGDWLTVVTLDSAGDQEYVGTPIPDPVIGNDDGNQYTLDIEIEWRDD